MKSLNQCCFHVEEDHMFILLSNFLNHLNPGWKFINVKIVDQQSGNVEYQGEAKDLRQYPLFVDVRVNRMELTDSGPVLYIQKLRR